MVGQRTRNGSSLAFLTKACTVQFNCRGGNILHLFPNPYL
ncbi:hypothetical protein YQE_07857, partial [Dendroctonus ponderosae]